MVLGPLVELASRMAWRSEPGPLSLVLVTVKMAAVAGKAQANNIKNKPTAFMDGASPFESAACLSLRFAIIFTTQHTCFQPKNRLRHPVTRRREPFLTRMFVVHPGLLSTL